MIELIQIARLKNTSLKKVILRDKIITLAMKGILIPFLTGYIILIIENMIG